MYYLSRKKSIYNCEYGKQSLNGKNVLFRADKTQEVINDF